MRLFSLLCREKAAREQSLMQEEAHGNTNAYDLGVV